ncbi:hypothetical protein [Streptomyces griseus]|uniref:hypothetical protein n=1 Tax=Streptomyces griseus TaxID=1911 RepID=UPI00131C6D4C|nr:hypothetical protein [Streptomyces griseus]
MSAPGPPPDPNLVPNPVVPVDPGVLTDPGALAALYPGLSGVPPARPTGAPSLGHGLALDDGDLVTDPRTGGPAGNQGPETLLQALLLAVETQLGTDRLNTVFGFDRLALGRYALEAPARKEYIRMELLRCLSGDRRIADVREVFFQDDQRYRDLRPDLAPATYERIVQTARASREYTVYAIVETIASSTLILTSGGRLD